MDECFSFLHPLLEVFYKLCGSDVAAWWWHTNERLPPALVMCNCGETLPWNPSLDEENANLRGETRSGLNVVKILSCAGGVFTASLSLVAGDQRLKTRWDQSRVIPASPFFFSCSDTLKDARCACFCTCVIIPPPSPQVLANPGAPLWSEFGLGWCKDSLRWRGKGAPLPFPLIWTCN